MKDTTGKDNCILDFKSTKLGAKKLLLTRQGLTHGF